MKTNLTMMVSLEYDNNLFDENDKEESDWFFEYVLNDGLALYSRQIGDNIGKITVHETGAELALLPDINIIAHLRAENERLREQIESMNEINTVLLEHGRDACHHLALILQADMNYEDMSQLLIDAAQFIVEASQTANSQN